MLTLISVMTFSCRIHSCNDDDDDDDDDDIYRCSRLGTFLRVVRELLVVSEDS